MNPSRSYLKMQEILRNRFIKVSCEGHVSDLHTFLKDFGRIDFDTAEISRDTDKVMLVGLLFAHPNHRLTHEYMFPNYDYLNIRSGDKTDFFWVGYDEVWEHCKTNDDYHDYGFRYRRRRDFRLEFDDEAFNSFRQHVQHMSRWEYSGGVDLILSAVHLGQNWDREVNFDFSNAVVLELDKLFEERNEEYIPRFIEELLRSAEVDEKNLIWKYSDQQGINRGVNIIKEWLLNSLPRIVGRELSDIADFAVKDLRR